MTLNGSFAGGKPWTLTGLVAITIVIASCSGGAQQTGDADRAREDTATESPVSIQILTDSTQHPDNVYISLDGDFGQGYACDRHGSATPSPSWQSPPLVATSTGPVTQLRKCTSYSLTQIKNGDTFDLSLASPGGSKVIYVSYGAGVQPSPGDVAPGLSPTPSVRWDRVEVATNPPPAQADLTGIDSIGIPMRIFNVADPSKATPNQWRGYKSCWNDLITQVPPVTVVPKVEDPLGILGPVQALTFGLAAPQSNLTDYYESVAGIEFTLPMSWAPAGMPGIANGNAASGLPGTVDGTNFYQYKGSIEKVDSGYIATFMMDPIESDSQSKVPGQPAGTALNPTTSAPTKSGTGKGAVPGPVTTNPTGIKIPLTSTNPESAVDQFIETSGPFQVTTDRVSPASATSWTDGTANDSNQVSAALYANFMAGLNYGYVGYAAQPDTKFGQKLGKQFSNMSNWIGSTPFLDYKLGSGDASGYYNTYAGDLFHHSYGVYTFPFDEHFTPLATGIPSPLLELSDGQLTVQLLPDSKCPAAPAE
jgi:hypothetical protein